MTKRDSAKFSLNFQPDFDEVKQEVLIGQWLEHVQSSLYKVEFKDKVFYLNKGQVKEFAHYAPDDPVNFSVQLSKFSERKGTLQNGDHLFMRLVVDDNNNKELIFEQSGDHVLETVSGKSGVHGVSFLLDYTLRWSSRIENFSGAVQHEIPLIFASFQFFCSTPMLIITITLLVYIIIWQMIAVFFFGGLSADLLHNLGLLATVLLGSYVVKGSLGVATFEKAAHLVVIRSITSNKAGPRSDPAPSEVGVEMEITHNAMRDASGKSGGRDVGAIEPEADMTPRESSINDDALQSQNIPTGFLPKVVAFMHTLASDALSLQDTSREKSLTGRKVKANGLTESKGFMEVLNVATEYLMLMSSKQQRFTSRVYSTYLLRASFVVVPSYMTYWLISAWVNLASCHQHHHYGFNSGNHRCTLLNLSAAYSLGFTLQWLAAVLGICNLMVSFSILMYSTDVANALSKYWLHRFRELRRISAAMETAAEQTAAAPDGKNNHAAAFTLDTLQPLIERDAYERYLFTHTFFTEASLQWSVYLFLCLAATFALFLESYLTLIYLYAQHQYVDQNYTILCVINAMVFSMVFGCMAYANSAVEKMRDGFLYAGANDYALMGGRTAWLEYVDKAPIYWYIFGFAIKRSDVVSYVGGLVSAVVGGVVMSVVVSKS